MKKILASLLAASMIIGMTACSSKQTETKSESSAEGEQVYRIGVIQLVEHQALNSAYEGFVDGLKENGLEDGKNIIIDYQNAQGEQSNCQTIASKLVNDQNDLILAIATPAAQAVANATSDIPILVTAVTDPASAKLVKDNTAPGGNVTGTSDLNPVEKQIELIKEFYPDAKTIGMLYCSGEANSKFQVDMAKEACEKLGMDTVDATISSTNELQQVVESLVGKVDAIYAPTDNMVATGMPTISMTATPKKVAVFNGEEGPVTNGGLATYGVNYYNLGKQTALQAVKILKEGASPAEMPIEYLEDVELVINQTIADELGVTIPQELYDQAKIVEMPSK